MNIVTIKMVTMQILTYAVLDYIDNLPVLFVINLFDILDGNIWVWVFSKTVDVTAHLFILVKSGIFHR